MTNHPTVEDIVERTPPSMTTSVRRAFVGVPLRVGLSFLLDAGVYVAAHGGDYHAFIERFQLDKFGTVCAAVFAYNILDEKYALTRHVDDTVVSIGGRLSRTLRGYDRNINGQ